MMRFPVSLSASAKPVSLEACAEQAGSALACAYSSSAEFDAAVIAARRAAGIYGPKRQRRQLLSTGAAVAGGLAVVVLAIGLLS